MITSRTADRSGPPAVLPAKSMIGWAILTGVLTFAAVYGIGELATWRYLSEARFPSEGIHTTVSLFGAVVPAIVASAVVLIGRAHSRVSGTYMVVGTVLFCIAALIGLMISASADGAAIRPGHKSHGPGLGLIGLVAPTIHDGTLECPRLKISTRPPIRTLDLGDNMIVVETGNGTTRKIDFMAC